MNYNFIKNPETNRNVSVHTKLGKHIINKYMLIGGDIDPKLKEEIKKWIDVNTSKPLNDWQKEQKLGPIPWGIEVLLVAIGDKSMALTHFDDLGSFPHADFVTMGFPVYDDKPRITDGPLYVPYEDWHGDIEYFAKHACVIRKDSEADDGIYWFYPENHWRASLAEQLITLDDDNEITKMIKTIIESGEFTHNQLFHGLQGIAYGYEVINIGSEDATKTQEKRLREIANVLKKIFETS
jgi:hypothetical protein